MKSRFAGFARAAAVAATAAYAALMFGMLSYELWELSQWRKSDG